MHRPRWSHDWRIAVFCLSCLLLKSLYMNTDDDHIHDFVAMSGAVIMVMVVRLVY